MNYKKINCLTTSEIGEVFIATRQIYPEKTGFFPAIQSGKYISSEEIMELWNYKDTVVKGLDTQIAHANLEGYEGDKKLEKLVDWKVNHFKKPIPNNTQKSWTSDLSKVKLTEGKPDYTNCIIVQTLSKESQNVSKTAKESVQSPKNTVQDVQNNWIVNGKSYPTAQKAATETNNTLKNIQRWCKNNKNNCSFSS